MTDRNYKAKQGERLEDVRSAYEKLAATLVGAFRTAPLDGETPQMTVLPEDYVPSHQDFECVGEPATTINDSEMMDYSQNLPMAYCAVHPTLVNAPDEYLQRLAAEMRSTSESVQTPPEVSRACAEADFTAQENALVCLHPLPPGMGRRYQDTLPMTDASSLDTYGLSPCSWVAFPLSCVQEAHRREAFIILDGVTEVHIVVYYSGSFKTVLSAQTLGDIAAKIIRIAHIRSERLTMQIISGHLSQDAAIRFTERTVVFVSELA